MDTSINAFTVPSTDKRKYISSGDFLKRKYDVWHFKKAYPSQVPESDCIILKGKGRGYNI